MHALSGEMRTKLTEQGLLVTPGSIAEFTRFQQEDAVQSAKIVKEANIKNE